MDTIYALSSGGLPSGVAIVRISGEMCRDILEMLCGGVPRDRLATLRTIRRRNGDPIDTGIVLFFRSPASFTGEDCAELHLHGGLAVIAALLEELASMPDCRHAEPGEFSRRAFLHGKLDLVEIEGLADLIAAETEMQRRLALEHAGGGQSILYATWEKRLTFARAMIEAELDFTDEDDVPGSVSDRVWGDMALLRTEVVLHLDKAAIGEIIRDGFKVAIVGRPNVGKSSFLNMLAKRDVAIVTPVAGTTRDVLTVDLDLEGFVVKLYDTAGLRDTSDLVEAEGIRRAHTVIGECDLILLLNDDDTFDSTSLIKETKVEMIRIRTKTDLGYRPSPEEIGISTVDGAGVDILLEAIRNRLNGLVSGSVVAVPTRRRHVEALARVAVNLASALDQMFLGLEERSEYLRRASYDLGRITGHVDAEDILDVIFSQFCVGK